MGAGGEWGVGGSVDPAGVRLSLQRWWRRCAARGPVVKDGGDGADQPGVHRQARVLCGFLHARLEPLGQAKAQARGAALVAWVLVGWDRAGGSARGGCGSRRAAGCRRRDREGHVTAAQPDLDGGGCQTLGDLRRSLREGVEEDQARLLAFQGDDIIWYTDFPRGMLGRLDLKTGDVKEWQSPSGPKSEPYGIVFTKGALWYNESGARPNTIVRFDPGSEKFQSWAIPGGGDIVRNMDVTPDGNPVTANSLANQVGLVTVE